MIEIEDKKVVFSTTILVKDDIEVKITDALADWPFNLILVFKPKEGSTPTFDFIPEGNTLRMTFKSWNNSLGSSLMWPVKIGTKGGLNVGVMIFHHKAGTMNKVDFQIMLGGEYAK